ncbi:hypothetical protein C4J81_12695 [Deltaproteobacteria bacterium Smac51]|nr:hypothetical protein C4J81_12695 [Deltaproteobacteria bacterium Smac51]
MKITALGALLVMCLSSSALAQSASPQMDDCPPPGMNFELPPDLSPVLKKPYHDQYLNYRKQEERRRDLKQLKEIMAQINEREKSPYRWWNNERIHWHIGMLVSSFFTWLALRHHKEAIKKSRNQAVLEAAAAMERHIGPWIADKKVKLRPNWKDYLHFFTLVTSGAALMDCLKFYKNNNGSKYWKKEHKERSEEHFAPKHAPGALDQMRDSIVKISGNFNASRFRRSPSAGIYAAQYARLLSQCLQGPGGAVSFDMDRQFVEMVRRGLSAALIHMARQCK